VPRLKRSSTKSLPTTLASATQALTRQAMAAARATGTLMRSRRPMPISIATSRSTAMSMPARVANDATKAACVTTVTTPNPPAPRARDNTICAAKVATAATAMPTTF
jgi:hypothetical protein